MTPCKYCDASLPGIDGMCLEHAKETAHQLAGLLDQFLKSSCALTGYKAQFDGACFGARAALTKAGVR